MLLPIVLLVLGLALVVAEVFFVSMGLLSLMALVAILAADVLAFEVSTTAGWVLIVAQVVLVPLLVVGAFRVLPRLRFGQRMLLDGPLTGPAGSVPDLEHLTGREGVALTDLRPSGTARIEGQRLSVVASDLWIPRGAAVRVTLVEGSEVKVRALDADDAGTP